MFWEAAYCLPGPNSHPVQPAPLVVEKTLEVVVPDWSSSCATWQVSAVHCCSFLVSEVPEGIAVDHLVQRHVVKEFGRSSPSWNHRCLSSAKSDPVPLMRFQLRSPNVVSARCAVFVLERRWLVQATSFVELEQRRRRKGSASKVCSPEKPTTPLNAQPMRR